MKTRFLCSIAVLGIFVAGCAGGGGVVPATTFSTNPLSTPKSRALTSQNQPTLTERIELPAPESQTLAAKNQSTEPNNSSSRIQSGAPSEMIELPAPRSQAMTPQFSEHGGGGGTGCQGICGTGPIPCACPAPCAYIAGGSGCGGGGIGGGGGTGGSVPRKLALSSGYSAGQFHVVCGSYSSLLSANVTVFYGNPNGVALSTFTTISAPGKADTFAFPSPFPTGNFITAIYTPQGGNGGPTGICSAAN